jgi:signal peptidase II
MKNTENKSNLSPLFLVILAAALVLFDQLTKYLAVKYLKGNEPFVLISNVLELHYLENTGAAFSMLEGQQWFLYIITAAFLIVAIFCLSRLMRDRKFNPIIICITVLCAGAVGNFIDRVVHHYVVDFIYFSIINFPIFNVADIYVTLGVIVLICLVLFKYKDDDFKTVFGNKNDGQQ